MSDTQRKKLIIDNRTDLGMEEVLPMVEHVVGGGYISGEGDKKQYCYCSVFNHPPDGQYVAAAFRNEKSDRILIYKEKSPHER